MQYLRDLISGTVFHRPQEEWNAHILASALKTTPDRIRTTLFMQGAAFTQICRTQRLMRALFESFQFNLSVADLKSRVGWTDSRDSRLLFTIGLASPSRQFRVSARVAFRRNQNSEWAVKNSIGRVIPEWAGGFRPVPYAGISASPEVHHWTGVSLRSFVLNSIRKSPDAACPRDRSPISSHHHLR
ncbi:hypothetical protein AWV80_17110 [Cupriavidus sp. UYMU48A]|nr:hypothetical protein AWV80_17110 [Cupriavidus sp. UYMU48A]